MRNAILAVGAAALSVAAIAAFQAQEQPDLGYSDTPMLPDQPWRVHDIKRPHPPKVKVAPAGQPVPAPSDAAVLFDGKDFSHWVQRGRRGADRGKLLEPKWKLQDGYMEIVGRTGDLITKEKFGDGQYHVEWMVPPEVKRAGQWQGNSGVLLMGRYEIQVLESHDNVTYADGQAGAIYGQWPPLVNPARPQGQWQVYDIVFKAPRFEGDKLVEPAYATVFFNGVLVHHGQKIIGRMAHRVVGTYAPHGPQESFGLQDHDVPVRYRNIWVRRLPGYDKQ